MSHQRHIFIGGSGRSGTTLLGTLFNLHPAVLFFGEPQFLANNKGLWDVVHDRCTVEQFATDMVGVFREKMVAKLAVRGFSNAGDIYSPDRVRQLVRETLGANADRRAAARAFIDALFALGLDACGKQHWVEKTPNTVIVADELYDLYPDMKYYHMLREPKSIYCSHLGKEWGVRTVPAFVAFYQDIMGRAWQRQLRIPPRAYYVLSLEELVRNKAEATLRVFQFAGLPCDDALLEACCERISDGGDHPERWRTMLTADERNDIDVGCGDLYRLWRQREERTRQQANSE